VATALEKKVVYLGSDGIGLRALEWFGSAERPFSLAGIVSGLDRRCGRGLRLTANPIAAWAQQKNIPLLQPSSPKEEILPWMEKMGATMGVVFAYGHILPQSLLEAIPQGFLNLHASLLPQLRGPSPIEGAILQRLPQTGISLMQLVKKMDAGPVYAQEAIPITAEETTPTLREKMSLLAVDLLDKHFTAILQKECIAQEQDHSQATYVPLIQKVDGLLSFSKSAAALEAQIRAYVTWPGSFFYHGNIPVRVGRATYYNDGDAPAHAPGTILRMHEGALEIATVDGILRCLELQLPTRKMLPANHLASFFFP
jgi:methionyl-tRNA formyltransferase